MNACLPARKDFWDVAGYGFCSAGWEGAQAADASGQRMNDTNTTTDANSNHSLCRIHLVIRGDTFEL